MNNVAALAASAIAVAVCAVWARQSDPLGWQIGTNIVLAALLLAVAVVRWATGVAPLVCFWIILLGIAVAIVASGRYSIGLKRLGLPRLRRIAFECAVWLISAGALTLVDRALRFPAD
jgi:hypothetical protein